MSGREPSRGQNHTISSFGSVYCYFYFAGYYAGGSALPQEAT